MSQEELKTSEATKPSPNANQVPYINDNYTFTDRRRDINMMLMLLDEKRESLARELGYVEHCIKNRDYPNINFMDADGVTDVTDPS